MGYEGGLSTLISGVPFSDQIQQDALYHSSFYDVLSCYLLAFSKATRMWLALDGTISVISPSTTTTSLVNFGN